MVQKTNPGGAKDSDHPSPPKPGGAPSQRANTGHAGSPGPGTQRALATYIKLARAANTAMAYARVGLEDAGLTLGQFAVLEALYHVGPLNLGELAKRVLTSGGNLTMVVDNLEKRGLVKRRQQGHDKRFIVASITATGRRLIARIFPQHSRRITEIMGRLSPAEQDALGKLCRKLGIGE